MTRFVKKRLKRAAKFEDGCTVVAFNNAIVPAEKGCPALR